MKLYDYERKYNIMIKLLNYERQNSIKINN